MTKIGYLDLKICQHNAQIVSNLTKSIYSCKNVLYKGKRRQILTEFFSSDSSKKPVEDETGINKVTRLDVANVRIILFDSSEMSKEARRSFILNSNVMNSGGNASSLSDPNLK